MVPTEGIAPTERTENAPVAYLVSRFPKLSETFVLFELLALRDRGLSIRLYALLRERQRTVHPEAQALLPEVIFRALWHPRTWWSAFGMLLRAPGKTLAAVGGLLRHNFGSARFLGTKLAMVPTALAFASDMRQHGVRHIHAHFVSLPAGMAWFIQRVTGITFSFTAHGSDLHRDQHMLREKLATAELAVTVSDFNRKLLAAHCPADRLERIRVIRCGADTEVFRPSNAKLQRQRSATLSQPRVACLGTLHAVKGQSILLQAFAQLPPLKRPQLTFIGDGPDRAELEAQARTCGVAAHFTGAVSRAKVADWLQTADIVVAPSVPTFDGRKEGIPVALMEAMASGCAVIASRLTGIPELVRHEQTGLLTEPGDAAGVAAAILRLLDDGELRGRCVTQGLEHVCAEFDQRRNAQRLATTLGWLES